MHCSLCLPHARPLHQLTSLRAKQSAHCVRSWSPGGRRFWPGAADCAAHVAASVEHSVAAAVDGFQPTSQQTSVGHGVLAQPVQPVQSCPTTNLQKAPDSVPLMSQPLQRSHQQEQGAGEEPLHAANPAQQQQTAVSYAQTTQLRQHKQNRPGRHRGRRRSDRPGTAPTTCCDARPPVSKQHSARAPAASHSRTGMPQQQQALLDPCGRGGSLKLAAGMSKLLSQGNQVLLPAGEGMQIPRGLAALASARSLMLSSNSAMGLVFQPSFSGKQPAAARPMASASAVAPGERQLDGAEIGQVSRANSSKGSTSNGILMTASKVAEAQLRRHEQMPLIAARYGSPAKLAAAAVARVCQQGYTAVRASGPDAVRGALQAVTEARHKLLSCGLDIAVVPATEFVDVETLPGQQEQQTAQQDADDSFSAGCGMEDNSRQFVRVTVLHVMRCQLKQPWKLLPHPVPVAESPAVVWHNRQQKKRRRHQQQLLQGVTGQQHNMAEIRQPPHQQQPHQEHSKHQCMAQITQAQQQDQVFTQQQQVEVQQQPHHHHHQQQQQQQQRHKDNRDQLLMHLRPKHVTDSPFNNTLLFNGGLAGGSTVPLMPSTLAAGAAVAAEGACRPPPKSADISGASGSSGSSIDGSIWCAADDVGLTAVYIGEGMSCGDDADVDEREVELIQLQTASLGHPSNSQHPGQALLLHKQRHGKSSTRQLVAAAQGCGQRAAGGASNSSNT